ncbi:MAG: hypothetical protein JSU72_05090 [Deltaproteobacteria bacterium]|nr:MAG: hypothetical protein JSU72_05090 [Deltaproteobacteria bacterium]
MITKSESMNIHCRRGVIGLLIIAALLYLSLCPPLQVQAETTGPKTPGGSAAKYPRAATSPLQLAQLEKRIKIAVFNFNILNLAAAGYSATVSNLFMTLLDHHELFEVMSRKELEASLWRAGLQQSEDSSRVRSVGTQLGLDGVIFGNIEKEGSAIGFEVKYVEMAGGETLLHRKEKVLSDLALRQKVEEITQKIAQIASNYDPQPTVPTEVVSLFPAQPTGLETRSGSRKVTLSWIANQEANIGGYKVFRSTTREGPFSKIASIGEHTFTDSGLEDNLTYYYKVQAFNQEGRQSAASTIIAAKTVPTPLSPIILETNPSIGGIKIRWTENPRKAENGKEVSGFKIYRADSPESEFRPVARVSFPSGRQSTSKLKKYVYEDSELGDGKKYYYRLTAFDDSQVESDFSGILEGRTVDRVTGIQATGNMIREIHLHWQPSPFVAVQGYRIYRSTSAEGTFEPIAELPGSEITTYVDQEALADATTYFYRVTVYNQEGQESGLSGIASATTLGKPPTPQGLTAQSGLVKRVTLSWQASPEEEVQGYSVYWHTDPAGKFIQIAKLKRRDTTSFVDTGDRDRPLGNNNTYYYMIASYNKVNVYSDPSPPQAATTKPRPQTPTGIAAKGGLPEKVAVSWDHNPEPDITYFHIWRQQQPGDFKEIKKVPGSETDFEDDGLDHGTTYIYRVQAEDADGLLSDLSPNAAATTKPLPQPPTDLEITALPQGFRLVWRPNPEPDVVDYRIYLVSFLGDKEIGQTKEIPFITTSLDPDKEYTVVITAVDQHGLESDKSEPVTVRTK